MAAERDSLDGSEEGDATKGGESGFRSRCLVVANDALYRLS